ncbi:MAG: SDR family NAD(P)-dependent oxidoreductase [Bacteroidota bacterium]
MNLSNHKILITGATAGIGEALLKAFLKHDNQIIALGRNAQKLAQLSAQYPAVIPFQCDLAEPADLDRLIVFVEQEHPDLSVLINNAGIQYNYQFEEEQQALAKIQREIDVNLIVPIKLISLLIPTLQNQPESAVVNVSSGLGLVPKMAAPVYCGTKAGLHIFTKALRYQLANIKLFEIIPPLVDTEMTRGRGKGKISPDQLAAEFIRAFARDHYELSVGKVKLLKLINRLSPRLAERIMR